MNNIAIRYLKNNVTVHDLLNDEYVINYAITQVLEQHKVAAEILERSAREDASYCLYEIQINEQQENFILILVDFDYFEWEKYFIASRFDETIALGDEPEEYKNIKIYILKDDVTTDDIYNDEHVINYSSTDTRKAFEEGLAIFLRMQKRDEKLQILHLKISNDYFDLLIVDEEFEIEKYLIERKER